MGACFFYAFAMYKATHFVAAVFIIAATGIYVFSL